jgi:hypothetical protein
VSDDAPNETATVATGGGGAALTLIVADPVWPSLVAVIDAVPTASPFTRPLAVTLAIAALADDQVTVRPVTVVPLASFVIATAWVL